MSLSADKFQKLLTTYSMVPLRYYTKDDLMKLVEVMCLENGELFLVYIPSDYEFRLPSGEEGYSLKQIEFDEDGKLPSKYAAKLNDMELSEMYDKVDLLTETKLMDKSVDVEKELIDQYRQKFVIPSSEEAATEKVRDLLNQLDRLSKCLDSQSYTLSVLSNSLAVIDRDHMYMIRGKEFKENRAYIVTVDFETLFQNIAYVAHDVTEINRAIHRILTKNHNTHMNRIDMCIDGMSKSRDILNDTVERIDRYHGYIESLKDILGRMRTREGDIRIALREMASRTAGISSEITMMKEREKLEKELEWIMNTRTKVYEKVVLLQKKSRDMSLTMDKLLFENLLLMVTIQRNLNTALNK